jgi:NitT/TauT family transport system substrate-binding protein
MRMHVGSARGLTGRLGSLLLGLVVVLACAPAVAPPPANSAGAQPRQAAAGAEPARGDSPASAPAPPRTVKFAVPGRGVAYLPLVVAQQEGILAKHGLEADIRPLRQDAANAALASGDVDYLTSTFSGVAGNLSGLPLVVVMVMTGRPHHAIMSREPLQSVQELRGKSLVTDVRGGMLDVMARMALQQAGVHPDTEVSFLYAGTPESRLGMLVANRVDAGTMDVVSAIKAREQGYHEVVDLGKVVTLPNNGLVTTRERIKERPDEIRTLARAILEGTAFLRANRERAVTTIAEWSDVDETLAGELYDLARDSFTLDGRISDSAMKTTIEAQAGYQPGTAIDLQRFVNFSLLPN